MFDGTFQSSDPSIVYKLCSNLYNAHSQRRLQQIKESHRNLGLFRCAQWPLTELKVCCFIFVLKMCTK